MHYYKILKHKAGFDEGTNYWEKILARYLAATGGGKIHTILPITFTSTSWKLAGWTIYGNNGYETAPQVYTGWEQGSRNASAQGGETYDEVKINSSTRVRNAELIPVVTPFYYKINSGYQIGATFFDKNGLALGSSSNVPFRSTPYTYTGVGKYVSFAIKNNASTAITPSSDFEVKIAESYVQGVGERTKNLYNPNATDVNNGYVNPGRLRVDGTINTGAISINVWVTEYIPVEEDSLYTLVELIKTSAFGICYYDNNKTYISGATYSGVPNRGNKTITTPTGCKYVRFTTAEGFNTMLVEGSTAPQTFIPYGYEVPLDIRHKTKNLLEITADTTTEYGVTFTVDRQAGTVTATGRSSSTSVNTPQFNFNGSDRKPLSNGVVQAGYIFSCPNMIYGAQAGIAYYDENRSYISEQVCDSTTSSRTISIPSNAVYYRFYVRKNYNAGDTDVIFKPMLRAADTSPDFEPYYLTNHEDIYIGSAPLTEGQTVSNTQDIEVFEGENTIDTTLYNKPVMEIEYE